MTMKVPILDLNAESREYGEAVRQAVLEVLESQHFIGGPAVKELERTVADYCQCRHAIAVGTGTDAILVSLMACDVGPGDEVITTPFTFFATAGSICRLGARPVFVDIEADSFNLDATQLDAAVTSRTKAIIAVHLFGQCADMDEVMHVGQRHGLHVIEDAAQAIGATYRGKRACSIGHLGCLSFYPTKNLSTIGEGGMILTNDTKLFETCMALRNHGESSRYHHRWIGGNFRFDTIKAAALLAKLPHLDRFTEARKRNAEFYDESLRGTGLRTPKVRDYNESVYHQYSILTDHRQRVTEALTAAGIGWGIYYPVPLHLQECFRHLGYSAGAFPVAEATAERILSIPTHPMLTDEQRDYVVDVLRSAAPPMSN